MGIPSLNRHRLSVEKNATNVPANEIAPGAAGAEVGAELQSLQRSFPPDSINEFIQKMTGGGESVPYVVKLKHSSSFPADMHRRCIDPKQYEPKNDHRYHLHVFHASWQEG